MHVYFQDHPQHGSQGFNLLLRDSAYLASRRHHPLPHGGRTDVGPVASSWPVLERWTSRCLWAMITALVFVDVLFTFGAPGLATLIGP